MNLALKILIGVLSSGVVATGTWFIYDQVNSSLEKEPENNRKTIQLTITKPPQTSTSSDTSYSGSGCFQKFFGIKIPNFSTHKENTPESGTKKFDTLFENTSTDIYGCAVGDGTFYEIVLKNEEIGFATWYDKNANTPNKQKVFKLTKSESTWQIEKGIWSYISSTERQDTNFTDKIKDKTSKGGNWSWLFMMSKDKAKDQASENMKEWKDVFYKGTTVTRIYKDNKWKTDFSFTPGTGKIPDFNKVTTLDDFCNERDKLGIYC